MRPFSSHSTPIETPEDKVEWLRLRQSGIGGSDASVIMGHNDHDGPLGLFESKVFPIPDEVIEAGEAAYWGHRLEDIVAQEFSIRTGYPVAPSKYMYRSIEWPWMLATVDRVVTEDSRVSILECKTRSGWVAKQWDEGVPAGIKDQCYHYMAVTGASRVWVAVLMGGQHFRIEILDRDEDYISELVEAERRFWVDHVESRIPPPFDASAGTRAIIEAKYELAVKDKVVELPAEARSIVLRLQNCKGVMDTFVEDREALKTQLKSLVGDAEYGTINGDTVVTWKQSRRSSVDVGRLKLEHPDVYKKVLREVGSRRFSVKGVEE